jgi:hypothetical protein
MKNYAKRAWVLIVLFCALMQVANASDGQMSELLLAKILNGLDEVQRELQTQTVKATVVLVTVDYDQPLATNAQTQQFDLMMVFFEWGYVVRQVTSDNKEINHIKPGMTIGMWAIRSNGFSQDVNTLVNPTSASKYLKGKDVDVSIRSSDFSPSFVFFPLIPRDMKGILTRLKNENVTQTTNLNSQKLLIVDGVSTGDALPEEESFQITFDLTHKMFPVEGTIYRQGKLLNKWSSTYLSTNQQGYYPDVFTAEVFRNDAVVYSRLYTNIIVTTETTEKHNLIESGHIPKGSIVNEYRFNRPFAYVQNDRSPNSQELSAMSSNDAAIIKYQNLNVLVSPLHYTSSQGKGRWIVITILGVWTIISGIFLFNKARKR